MALRHDLQRNSCVSSEANEGSWRPVGINSQPWVYHLAQNIGVIEEKTNLLLVVVIEAIIGHL